MHRKKILAVILAGALMAMPGCGKDTGEESPDSSVTNITIGEDGSAVTDGSGEDGTDEGSGTSGEVSSGVADEQAAGAAQEAADEIDRLHAESSGAGTGGSVDQAQWDGRMLELEDSGSWVRLTSEETGDGGFEESYSCDGRLEYTWSCDPSLLAESGSESGDEELAESLAGKYLENQGWILTSAEVSQELADELDMPACEYTAYEDDNGYSMLHRGVVLTDGDVCYIADFRMMEGDMGQYESSVQEWLQSLSFN